MRLLAHGKEIHSFNELLVSYAPSEFNSPLRSTIPLLCYWSAFDVRQKAWLESLGLGGEETKSLEFEFAVKPIRGKGKSSFTDLAVTTDQALIAVEAKYLEPPYKTCQRWLGPEPTENRKEVLLGWLELIERKVKRPLRPEEVLGLPYQLVHRTASACSMPRLSPVVIYQIFDPSKKAYYAGILQDLASVVGDRVDVRLHVSRFEPLHDYQLLIDKFKAGERELSQQVVSALRAGTIGEFPDETFAKFA